MGKILFSILAGGLLVAGAVYAVNAHNDQINRLQLELGRQKLRAQYLERIGTIDAASDVDRHKQELSNTLKWYDAELADLYNDYPGLHDPDGPMKELQAEVAAGQLKPDELANKKEWYDESKNLYDAIEHGKYDPLMTTVVEGIRMDLLSLKRVTYEGRSRLRMDVVLWGAPRREVATKIEQGRESRVKEQLDFGFKGIDFEFVDEDQKLIGGGSAGVPTMVVDYPERWIPDFPPQVALAIWYLDPFPAETKNIDMKLTAEVRSPTSQAFPITQDWKLVPQPDWLIRPGEKFEGEERVMSKEEMDRSGKAHAEN